MTTPVTVAQLRYDFPEFASTEKYPASGVQFWLNLAYQLLNADRWGDQITIAAELFTAHNITIEAKAQAAAAKGGIPGADAGVVSAKSVDKVSISYDTSSAMELDAGHWNTTIYGTRYIRLAMLFGAGPVHIGPGGGFGASGWSGPRVTPGFSNFG